MYRRARSQSVSPRFTVCVVASLRVPCATAVPVAITERRAAAVNDRPKREVITRSRGCGARRTGAGGQRRAAADGGGKAALKTIRAQRRNERDRWMGLVAAFVTWIALHEPRSPHVRSAYGARETRLPGPVCCAC